MIFKSLKIKDGKKNQFRNVHSSRSCSITEIERTTFHQKQSNDTYFASSPIFKLNFHKIYIKYHGTIIQIMSEWNVVFSSSLSKKRAVVGCHHLFFYFIENCQSVFLLFSITCVRMDWKGEIKTNNNNP